MALAPLCQLKRAYASASVCQTNGLIENGWRIVKTELVSGDETSGPAYGQDGD